MSEYTLVILAQSALIFIWVIIVKYKNRPSPEFNHRLKHQVRNTISSPYNDMFEEYIRITDCSNDSIHDPVSEARAKLRLIEEHDIDRLLEGDEKFEQYKRSLLKAAR